MYYRVTMFFPYLCMYLFAYLLVLVSASSYIILPISIPNKHRRAKWASAFHLIKKGRNKNIAANKVVKPFEQPPSRSRATNTKWWPGSCLAENKRLAGVKKGLASLHRAGI